MSFPDYYAALRLNRNADSGQIKKAFRKQALKWHPDRNPAPEAHDRFIVLNEAYLILSDKEAKDRYDREYDRYFAAVAAGRQEQGFTPGTTIHRDFQDDDLRQWAQNAREQADSFARMAFSEFARLVLGVVKETGFQLSNALLYGLGLLLFTGGCGNLFVGPGLSGTGNPVVGILFMLLGGFLLWWGQKRYDQHEV